MTDLNEPWHRFPKPRRGTVGETLSPETLLSGGVRVFGASVQTPPGPVPAVVFKFACPDGSGFYPPMLLVAKPEELRQLAALVDQAAAAALVAAHAERKS